MTSYILPRGTSQHSYPHTLPVAFIFDTFSRCPNCKGTGEGDAPSYRMAWGEYEVDGVCPACGGAGCIDAADVLEAFCEWEAK